MVCRLFVDKVGNSDLNGSAVNDNVRYLSLTGILTTQDFHDARIIPALDPLKTATFGTKEVIHHRREIVRREGPFAIFARSS
jgi:hypothetical protein